MEKDLILGIDTSNYTTSVALADRTGACPADLRKLLRVEPGKKGLRQSDALFQHMENLPELIETALNNVEKGRLAAVAVSEKPRPKEGSYMPVFKAGLQFARALTAALDLPLLLFSHQEGHLASAAHNTPLQDCERYLAWQLSGGTCELLDVRPGSIEIIGGSLDISAGQLIDRVGVALRMDFPAGGRMDKLALEASLAQPGLLKKVSSKGTWANLSGLETQALRLLEDKETEPRELVGELFARIGECFCHITEKAAEETGCRRVLFAGGVSSSSYLREYAGRRFAGSQIEAVFGERALMSDNAVGIALLGGKSLWQ